MRLPRVRFTVRRMMAVVAVVAFGLLGVRQYRYGERMPLNPSFSSAQPQARVSLRRPWSHVSSGLAV